MSTAIQRRRGTTAQHAAFAGLNGELTVDTDKKTVVVHDGTTAGGFPLARQDFSNVNSLALPLGTAGAPVYSFTGDTNTGIYSPGADQVAISTGGSGRVFIDGSGNVVIGQSTATGRLTLPVNNTISWQSSNVQDQAIYADGSSNLRFYTVSTERLRIDSSGRVGIGTSAPGTILDVSAAQAIIRATSSTGTNYVLYSATNGTGSSRMGVETSTGGGLLTGSSANATVLGSSSNHPLHLGTNTTTALTIDTSQRVGIGTTSISSNLQIRPASGDDSAFTNGLRVERSDTPGQYALFNYAGGAATITAVDTAGSTPVIRFYRSTNGSTTTESLRIDASGRVGIGTTSPGYLLDLSASTPVLNIASSATSGDGAQIRFVQNNGRVGRLYLTSESGLGAGSMTLENPDGRDIIFRHISNERARIDSSGRLLVGTSSARVVYDNTPSIQLEGTDYDKGSLSVVNNQNTFNGADFILGKSRGTSIGSNTIVQANDDIGRITWVGADGTDIRTPAAQISVQVDGTPGANDMPGRLVFSTTADGASSPTERMRITSNGNVAINCTGLTGDAPNVAGGFYTSTNGNIKIRVTSDGISALQFYSPTGGTGAPVGSIVVNASSTSYSTSSDYRLKENITAVADGITRLQQLKPSRFNFIADPAKTVDGFIAHEVQDVVPEAITGEKDAVDDEGNPQYQGIDQSKLVPLLTAALQEAIGEIESLKARVAALESA